MGLYVNFKRLQKNNIVLQACTDSALNQGRGGGGRGRGGSGLAVALVVAVVATLMFTGLSLK